MWLFINCPLQTNDFLYLTEFKSYISLCRWKDLLRKLETYTVINDGDEKEDADKLLQEVYAKVEAISSCLEGPAHVRSEEDALQQLQKQSEMRRTVAGLTDRLRRTMADWEKEKPSAELSEAAGKATGRCLEASRRSDEVSHALSSALNRMGAARVAVGRSEREMTRLEADLDGVAEKARHGPDVVRTANTQIKVTFCVCCMGYL